MQTGSELKGGQGPTRHPPWGRSLVDQWSRLECAQAQTMTTFLRANMALLSVSRSWSGKGEIRVVDSDGGLLEGDDDEDVRVAFDGDGFERPVAADQEHPVDDLFKLRRCGVLPSVVVLDNADRVEVMERAVDDEDRREVVGVVAAVHPVVIGDGEIADARRLGHAAPPAPSSSAVGVASKYEGTSSVTRAVSVSAVARVFCKMEPYGTSMPVARSDARPAIVPSSVETPKRRTR